MKRHLPKLVSVVIAAALVLAAVQPWGKEARDALMWLAGLAVGKEWLERTRRG